MTYALLWILLSGMALAYNHPRLRSKYMLHEGGLSIAGGLLSIVVITLGSDGGIFWSGRTMFDQTRGGIDTPQHYMKDLVSLCRQCTSPSPSLFFPLPSRTEGATKLSNRYAFRKKRT